MNSHIPAHPASQPQANNTIPFPKKEAAPKAPSKLEQLVVLEGEIHELPSRAAAGVHAVNATRGVLGYEQAFLLAIDRRGKARVEAASSLASVEHHAPLLRDVCAAVVSIPDHKKPTGVDLAHLATAHRYPHRFGLWLPLADRKGRVFAGLLIARDTLWQKPEIQIGTRVAGCYALAMRALSPPSLLGWFTVPRWSLATVAVVAAALSFVPVHLSVLSPFEVVAADPHLVAAPLDGVIAHIEAEPNARVQAGQLLFRLEDTVLKAEAAIATQKADVAAARYATAQNGAFSDMDLKRSVAVAAKEYELARAEQDFSMAMLARTEVRADRSGVLIYSSKSDWIGKPVRVGERVMEIADPQRVEYRVDVGVHDAIALAPSNDVKLFFDADPLHHRDAKISSLSFHASPQADGQMTYRVTAQAVGDEAPQRIGFRGTAQVKGEEVSLGFYILRRPIAALRQAIGY
jgi:multidrug resistance efflux pump